MLGAFTVAIGEKDIVQEHLNKGFLIGGTLAGASLGAGSFMCYVLSKREITLTLVVFIRFTFAVLLLVTTMVVDKVIYLRRRQKEKTTSTSARTAR